MRPRVLVVILGAVGMLAVERPCHALPEFARRYGLECQTCHSVPPRLNSFGLAFQANHLNLPAGNPPAPKKGLSAIPISAIAEFSFEDNRSEDQTSAKFRELEVYFASGFRVGSRRPGGYLVSVLGATTEEDDRAGDLPQAWVGLPIAGQRGQWALLVGQFEEALRPQWVPANRLADELPAAIADDFDKFSFAGSQSGVRVSYFDRRGQGTADGRYLTVGVPFEGQLALNHRAQLRGLRGVFAHAFWRQGLNSLGAFAYTHAGNTLGGLLATHELQKNLYLLGAGAIGHDDEGTTRRLSLEGEYVANPRLALTARLDALGGTEDSVGPTVAVTYYPLKLPVLRLTLETTQRKGNRSLALIARGQF
jgi:hypothetical protein